MENKREKIILCVGCETRFNRVKENDGSINFIPESKPVELASIVQPMSKEKLTSPNNNTKQDSKKDSKDSTRNDLTNRMGEKLLQGWAMYFTLNTSN
jgi:hypothetical protein